jgi:hypothetical protein
MYEEHEEETGVILESAKQLRREVLDNLESVENMILEPSESDDPAASSHFCSVEESPLAA